MMRTGLAGLFVGLTMVVICTLPVAAEPNSIFNSVLPQLKRQTRIPIALPKNLPSTLQQNQSSVKLQEVSSNSYTINLYSAADCTANACFRGAFYAEPATTSRSSEFKYLDKVSLQGGITGYFRPVSCGASCVPANLAWVRNGTVYSISLPMPPKNEQSQRSTLVALANSALQQSAPAIANQSSSSKCLTWAAFSRDLPSSGGRGGQWKAFGDLPPKFQNGCVLLQDNNSLDIAYVLKQEISAERYWGNSTSSFQQALGFDPAKEAALEQLVTRGNALKVTWLTPTNGTIPYLRSIPRDRAFLRKDGMTCFNTVCMKSGALSHQQLAQILGNR